MHRRQVFLLILAVAILAAPFVAEYHDKQVELRESFELAFGTSPRDSTTAQWAVNYTLTTLADDLKNCRHEYEVFPGDNYSLETIVESAEMRLLRQRLLAKQLGFTIPPEVEAALPGPPLYPDRS